MEDELKSEVESDIDSQTAEHAESTDQAAGETSEASTPSAEDADAVVADENTAADESETTASVSSTESEATESESPEQETAAAEPAAPKSDPMDDLPPIDDEEDEVDPSTLEKSWYILKVQVNRETSICDGLKRRVQQFGLQDYFGEMLVPTEDVREYTKSGKQRIVKRKLYPGYIMVNMAITEDSWWLVRDTPGIGDFTGMGGKPAPLGEEEIKRIMKVAFPETVEDGEGKEEIKTAIKHKMGDRVRVKDGNFENFEGDVSAIDERNGRITVLINIFGRLNPVELDHWQVEAL